MLDLAERHLETIKRILAAYVGDCEVRAFGSRGNGTATKHSDLDLAIVGNGKLERRVKTLLREAFEESDLPFRVDVIDYNAVSQEFRALIEQKYELIQQRP
ncbi:MAG: nucleotidyltransferase family protein [Planctomycetota bacterium]|jgi:predicted nucleotidyltransferase